MVQKQLPKEVKIGNQVWMTENLKVTHYRNGDAIPKVTDNKEWSDLKTGAYCITRTGEYLYNWYAVNDSRGLAPEGWHVPSDNEWKELETTLGMNQDEEWHFFRHRGTNEGSKLAGNADLWKDGDLVNNTEFGTSGFNALPSSYRLSCSYHDPRNGRYLGMGRQGCYWSSTEEVLDLEAMLEPGDTLEDLKEDLKFFYSACASVDEIRTIYAWHLRIEHFSSGVLRTYSDKHNGFSVRCVKTSK